jgi:hypothetical protein
MMKIIDHKKQKTIARRAAIVGGVAAIVCSLVPPKYQQPCAAVAALMQLKCKG